MVLVKMRVSWICAKSTHAAYADGISMDTDTGANTTLNLNLKPGEFVSTKIDLSDSGLRQGLLQINVELSIKVDGIQDPLVLQRSFDDYAPRGPPR
jgi:hypothetical protein